MAITRPRRRWSGDDRWACLHFDVISKASGECRGDAFPDDPMEWADTDNDGTGDNADADDDNDGVDDVDEVRLGLNPHLVGERRRPC